MRREVEIGEVCKMTVSAIFNSKQDGLVGKLVQREEFVVAVALAADSQLGDPKSLWRTYIFETLDGEYYCDLLPAMADIVTPLEQLAASAE